MIPGLPITNNYLLGLYQTHNFGDQMQPVLQILGFEQSLQNPQTEIIIRLSDEKTFIDCSLLGPYMIKNKTIISTSQNTYQGPIKFDIYDMVRLTDTFMKIDTKKICHLQIIVRKMQLVEKGSKRVGLPQQLSQYYEYHLQGNQTSSPDNEHQQGQQNKKDSEELERKPEKIRDSSNPAQINNNNKAVSLNHEPHKQGNPQQISKQQNQQNNDLNNVPQVKIQSHYDPPQPQPKPNIPNIKAQTKKEDFGNNGLLTYDEVIEGKQGAFLGRLIRIKSTSKETREGHISVLYLGLIDLNGELARINLAGRVAMREAKVVKKGFCYRIKGLDLYKSDKLPRPQIRMKDKDATITLVNHPAAQSRLKHSYHFWDHQNNSYETENVDVIGVIDEIQEKATYPQAKSGENRQVIRIVIRNIHKIVKVSFWAEQISSLVALGLKKGEAVIMEDIKRKKNMFLDFVIESTVIRLNQYQGLRRQFEYLLPIEEQTRNPRNVAEFIQFSSNTHTSGKVYFVRAYLIKIHEHRIIYKLCENCDRKVQKFLQVCNTCGLSNFYFKFNCQLQFADYSASFQCVAFEYTAQRLLNHTAFEISEMSSERLQQLIEECSFVEYLIGIQNRNVKMIVRSIEKNEQVSAQASNIATIRQLLDQGLVKQ